MPSETIDPPPRKKALYPGCLPWLLVGFACIFLICIVFNLPSKKISEISRKQCWEEQIAEVEAGKQTRLIWPEPEYLEAFVREKPEVAAKVKEVDFTIGKVSDERFGFIRQFPNLEGIVFYEVWEGADVFLSRIEGMESIRRLSFSKTQLSEVGMKAVASFPNLKSLHFGHFWSDADLSPLTGHKSIESIYLDEVAISKTWLPVFASFPSLQEILIDGREATDDQIQDLKEALPQVKIKHNPSGR
jgi:hypothetical protein